MNGDEKSVKKRGIILGLLGGIGSKIAETFTNGTVYKLFTSHQRAERAFQASAIVVLLRKFARIIGKPIGKLRTAIAKQFEQSMILRIFSMLYRELLNTSSRVLGAFSLTWSVYAVLIAMIKRYVMLEEGSTATSLLCGGVVFLASFPLIFSDKQIITLFAESPIFSSFLKHVVGVPEEALRPSKTVRSTQSYAVILGILLGTLTYIIPPLYMIVGSFALIVISLVLAYPECGVVISIAAAPLLGFLSFPSISLAVLVLITAFAYTVKVIRGKRVFAVGLSEFAVCAFISAVLLGGFTPGNANTLETALLTVALMLIFPLTVNLMKYKHWIKTCVIAFAVPTAIVAFIGIFQYMLGFAPYGWIDESLFTGITSRTTSVFGNPNVLGVFLVMLFPMVLTYTLRGNDSRVRILGMIVSIVIIVCTVLTYSRSAWLALAAGGILFATLISPNGILWLFPTVAATALAAFAFPKTVGARIFNFITLADSANSYRVSVWNSSWNMFLGVIGGGVGMGEEAFKTGYLNFAESGTESVMHSHSLYLQIGIQLGLVGLVLFLFALTSISAKCATTLRGGKLDRELSVTVKACLSGAAALLVAGVFDYTWYNFRIMFIFWALLGLACASANIGERESRTIYIPDDDERSAFVTVAIQSHGTVENK